MSIQSMISHSLKEHGFCKIHIRNGALVILQEQKIAGQPLLTSYTWMGKLITEDKAKHLIRTRFVQMTMGQHL